MHFECNGTAFKCNDLNCKNKGVKMTIAHVFSQSYESNGFFSLFEMFQPIQNRVALQNGV